MKKLLFSIILVLLITGCSDKLAKEENIVYISNEEFRECIENNIQKYLFEENEKLYDVKEDDIVTIEDDTKFSGKYSENGNLYVIKSWPGATWDRDKVSKYILYFANVYEEFQQYDYISRGFSVYMKSDNNDFNFEKIARLCNKPTIDSMKPKYIPDSVNQKIKNINKIVIKKDGNIINSITDKETIEGFKKVVRSAKQYGNIFTADGTNIKFEVYEEDKLIETFAVWYDERIAPESISSNYYSNSIIDEFSLKKLITDSPKVNDYSITFWDDGCNKPQELIYMDSKNLYYSNCENLDKILVVIGNNHITMKFKYALEKGYIDGDTISKDEYKGFLAIISKEN